MAYDEELVQRLREQLADETVTERRMFGGLTFLLGGHMTVTASGRGGLMVRVDPADADALLAQDGVEPLHMGGRAAMAGWLRVDPAVLEDDAALAGWVARSVAYVRTLPPKR